MKTSHPFLALFFFVLFALFAASLSSAHTLPGAECATSEHLKNDSDGCIAKGHGYGYYYTDQGCRNVECFTNFNLPSPIEIPPKEESTICNKVVDAGGCVSISCTDGYNINSCSAARMCREASPDCKAYFDRQGCYMQICTDGYEKRKCPEGAGNGTLGIFEAIIRFFTGGK